MLRDIPEPAGAARRLQDQRGAFVAARVAIGAFPVRPDRPFVQDRIPDAQPQPILNEPGLAARVDHDPRPHFAHRALRGPDRHADRPPVLEEDVQHAHALVRRDPVRARVLEQQLIELAAHDLPGLRALVRLVVPEVEGRRQLAARVDELHAVFLDERALLHRGQHAQALEDPVGLRDQRLADVKARKTLPLEQRDPVALLREERRDSRARRPTANDHHLGLRRRGRHAAGSGGAGAACSRAAISGGMAMPCIG